jgi:hypothetical protein
MQTEIQDKLKRLVKFLLTKGYSFNQVGDMFYCYSDKHELIFYITETAFTQLANDLGSILEEKTQRL